MAAVIRQEVGEPNQGDVNEEENDDDWDRYDWESLGSLPLTIEAAYRTRAFACSAIHDQMPNPGIYVNEFGTVGFPVSSREIEFLKASCARFLSEQEVASAREQKRWDLRPESFWLRNLHWKSLTDDIVATVHKELGLLCEVSDVYLELQNFTIHGVGGSFAPLESIKETEDTLGTLIVILPTPHKGGELMLSHKNVSFRCETEIASELSLSWLAWFNDVDVRSQPVCAGNRIMLTYSLHQKLEPGRRVQQAPISNCRNDIKSMLEDYERALRLNLPSDFPDYAIYRLSHPYAKQGLKLNDLQGDEREHVKLLSEICGEVGFGVYLTGIERTKTFDKYDRQQELHCSAEFTNVTHLNGRPCSYHSRYDDHNYLYDTWYDNEKPDKQEVDDHSRRSYGYNTHEERRLFWWHTALILVPPSKWVDFHVHTKNIFPSAMTLLDDLLGQAKHDVQSRRRLEALCKKVLTPPGLQAEAEPRYLAQSREFSTKIISTASEQKWAEILSYLPIERQVVEVENIGAQIGQSGIEKWNDMLSDLVKLKESLEGKWEILSNLAFTIATLEKDPPRYPMVQKWFARCVHDTIEGAEVRTNADARTLSRFLCYYNWPFAFDSRKYMMKLENANNLMIASFIIGFDDNCLRGPEGDLRAETKDFVTNFWSSFSYTRNPAVDIGTSQYISADDLGSLVGITSEMVEAITCEGVMDKLHLALSDVSSHYLKGPLVDFVRDLVQKDIFTWPTIEIPANLAAISRYITKILSRYIDEHVGAQPYTHPDWTLPTHKGCSRCADCLRVGNFMAHPTQRDLIISSASNAHIQPHFLDSQWIKISRSNTNAESYIWHKRNSPQNTAVRCWQIRRNSTVSRLSAIDGPQQGLRKYLGSQYDRIMSAQILPASDQPRLSIQNPPITAEPISPGAATGRVSESTGQTRKRLGSPVNFANEEPQKRRRPDGSENIDVVDLT